MAPVGEETALHESRHHISSSWDTKGFRFDRVDNFFFSAQSLLDRVVLRHVCSTLRRGLPETITAPKVHPQTRNTTAH